MKILIIEDEPDIRDTLRDLLEMNGHAVTVAVDGPEGVRLAADGPELILCDIGLPGLDGYQVIAALRQQPATRDVPFIFLTARADRSAQRQGMALGADDYITKPFTEKEIIEAINARVRRQLPLRERLEQLLTERRSEVGANWSHELMTPLTAVLGGLEMIEEEADDLNPAELRSLLGIVRSGAERQLALSRKLILHYELEQLKARPPAEAPLCQAAEGVLAGAAVAAKANRRIDEVKVHADLGEVALAENHLLAAVAELTDNACRFSAPGKMVTVTGTRRAGRYLIEVVDHGFGMTEDQTQSIAPFVQFGREKREQQGLGLGLGNARAIAELAGGRLTLTPGAAGEGLTATLDLPCR